MSAQKKQQVNQEEVANYALKEAKKLGCDDVSAICSISTDNQVRFANNSITLVNSVSEITLDVYLSKAKRRVVGSSYNPSDRAISRFIENLVLSCKTLPESQDYVPLPKGPSTYRPDSANFDPAIEGAPLVDFTKETIAAALKAGGVRVSGSLNTNVADICMVTSAGASGSDKSSEILLNVRAFADDNSSGNGLSCSSYVDGFEPAKAGRRAGELARKSLNSKSLPEGKYDIVFTPTVISNILPIASSASAFDIESGNSFLVDKLGQKIGVERLDIDDFGVFEKGLGGRIFDDEGMPTGTNNVIRKGVFETMLHNSSTAKKFGKDRSTGNAGIIAPRPTTIVFSGGDSSLEEMIRETREGLYVTNNWYTRYQNMRSGDYSTVPRDAAFTIEGGEIKEPVSGFRLSDSIPRQLANIELISRDREWIKWWEVRTPTLAPAMMIKKVRVTRAVGS